MPLLIRPSTASDLAEMSRRRSAWLAELMRCCDALGIRQMLAVIGDSANG